MLTVWQKIRSKYLVRKAVQDFETLLKIDPHQGQSPHRLTNIWHMHLALRTLFFTTVNKPKKSRFYQCKQ